MDKRVYQSQHTSQCLSWRSDQRERRLRARLTGVGDARSSPPSTRRRGDPPTRALRHAARLGDPAAGSARGGRAQSGARDRAAAAPPTPLSLRLAPPPPPPLRDTPRRGAHLARPVRSTGDRGDTAATDAPRAAAALSFCHAAPDCARARLRARLRRHRPRRPSRARAEARRPPPASRRSANLRATPSARGSARRPAFARGPEPGGRLSARSMQAIARRTGEMAGIDRSVTTELRTPRRCNGTGLALHRSARLCRAALVPASRSRTLSAQMPVYGGQDSAIFRNREPLSL